ncbi:MAG: hypothetical protein ACYTEQ_31305 [Planctomycetota bacterium]|jgi:hypothetical protein
MCERGEQTRLKIGDEFVWIDDCLLPIVKALNDNGIKTEECCCGHDSVEYGFIALADGRDLIVTERLWAKGIVDKRDRLQKSLDKLMIKLKRITHG